jgi:hypothetical protein
MAITNANFNNIDYVKASGKRVITCSSDKIGTSNVFNYRFLLEMQISGKTYSYTFRPNNENYGFINITKILQAHIKDAGDVQQAQTVPEGSSATVVQFKQNIHTIPHSGTSAQITNSNNLDTFLIVCTLFDFYGDTIDAVPTKRTAGSSTGNLYVISGYDNESDLINVNYNSYKLTSLSAKFLNNNYEYSGSEYIVRCTMSDWGTLSAFRPSAVNTSQSAQYINITYVDTSGGTSNASVEVNTNVQVQNGLITTFPAYPQNLNKLQFITRPIDVANLSHYIISASTTTPLGNRASAYYKFIIEDDCEKYDRQRFAYINNFGVWEYITFNELRTDNISSSPTNIKGSVFNYDGNYEDKFTANGSEYREAGYVPNVAHRGEKTVATNFNETFTVNTGYLSKSDTEKVKDMFLSHKISYINTDGSARAVILENSSINAINNINKHYEQVSYSLTFRYSVPTYNNIIF